MKKNENKKDLKRYWENQRAISTRINLWFENFRLVLYSWSCFIFLIGIRFTWSLRVNMIYISLPTFSKPGQCQGQIYSLNVCLEFCQFQVRKIILVHIITVHSLVFPHFVLKHKTWDNVENFCRWGIYIRSGVLLVLVSQLFLKIYLIIKVWAQFSGEVGVLLFF